MVQDYQLAQFLKKLEHGYDRRAACVSGAWLHTWHVSPTDEERVVRCKFASSQEALTAFRAFMRGLTTAAYERRPENWQGWTIGPRGQCGYHMPDGTWRGQHAWRSNVEVEVISNGRTIDKTAKPPPKRVIDRAALRRLTKSGPKFIPSATYPDIVEAVNSWFVAVDAAGIDLDAFPLVDQKCPVAIATTGAYSAAQIRAVEHALAKRPSGKLAHKAVLGRGALPRSYAELLRSVGDVVVLGGPHQHDGTFPLRKRTKWPMRGDLVHETQVLHWDVDRHGERGSFTTDQITGRRWLRFGGDVPGGADHTYVMDLDVIDRGEPAIYRIPDINRPTEIAKRATVFGVRAWLLARVAELIATARGAI